MGIRRLTSRLDTPRRVKFQQSRLGLRSWRIAPGSNNAIREQHTGIRLGSAWRTIEDLFEHGGNFKYGAVLQCCSVRTIAGQCGRLDQLRDGLADMPKTAQYKAYFFLDDP